MFKISASNKVIPDLSLADTVENLTLDKVNNFVPRQLHSSQKTGRAYFEKKTGRVNSKYRKRVYHETKGNDFLFFTATKVVQLV